MRNTIPLILSVLLGIAAVFAVSRLMTGASSDQGGRTVAVTVAASDLSSLKELTEGSLTFVEMPANSVPKGALLWANVAVAYGQRPQRRIDAGDYLMVSDIRSRLTLADCAKAGEWTIPVTFADPALVSMLMPDDEIAILATYNLPDKDLSKEMSSVTNMTDLVTLAMASDKKASRVTVVLLPCVRVIGLGGNGGDFRSAATSASATIFVSLPPQQASVVVAAQQIAELHPVLRSRNDPSAMSRDAGGLVNAKTFEEMASKLTPVTMPAQLVH